MKHSAQPRRILLAVTGLTPQVVTETLYALACNDTAPWVPDEIHLITTQTGAENARLNLLLPGGWFHRLCADYQLPQIAFPQNNIHILRDEADQPLDDIRTGSENARAADFIVDTVRQLTQDPASELHVSIAGGRKTMGYFLGYALSLYGRPQDRLSHVLVSEPYEANRDFYYPTPYDHPIHTRRGDREVAVDARLATVELAEIPFVRLRDGLPERLRAGKCGFSRVVDAANRAQLAPRLVLNTESLSVFADDEPIEVSKTEFAVLLWLAERCKRGEPETDWLLPEMAKEYLEVAGRVLNRMSAAYDTAEKTLEKNPELVNEYFQPHKSRLKKNFETVLGPVAAARYVIDKVRMNRGGTLFFLPLDPDQIEIRHHR